MPETTHTAILSLGSNLGNRSRWLSKASEEIEALPDTRITNRSSILETEPIDVPEEFSALPFLNAVLIIETTLTPQQLSESIHTIENTLQRTRSTPNAPRTIDIDIITFDNIKSDDPTLTLPHPRAHQRRFVLQPLAEIAPEFTLPGQELTVSELLDNLPGTSIIKLNAQQWIV